MTKERVAMEERITMEGILKTTVKKEVIKVIKEAKCLNCGHLLNTPSVPIEGYPSIQLGFRFTKGDDKEDHLLCVSAIWGSMTLKSFPEIPEGEVLKLFCPSCKRLFPKTATVCGRCGAPVAKFQSEFGIVHVCTRRGCPWYGIEKEDY